MSRIKLAEPASQAGATDEAIQEFARAADLLKVQGRYEEYMRVAERLHLPPARQLGRRARAGRPSTSSATTRASRWPSCRPCPKAEPREPENVSLLALAFEQLDPPKAVSVLASELAEMHDGAGRTAERDVAIRRALALEPGDAEARALGASAGACASPGVPAASSSHLVPVEPRARDARARAPPPVPRAAPPPPPAAAAERGELFGRAAPGQDVPRILAEAEVFVKYGLLDRAADHLRRLFESEPDYVQARERLDAVLTQLGHAPLEAADPLADVATPPPVVVSLGRRARRRAAAASRRRSSRRASRSTRSPPATRARTARARSRRSRFR